VLRRIGGFREPNGLCLLPSEVSAEVGYDVVVADTVGHRLQGLELATGATRVLAGDGRQWMQGDGTARLSSPWDVAWWRDRVWIAMAGIHQLWTFDPRSGTLEVAAGTTNEGLVDGPLGEAWFAQTSRLAPDGDRLWLADSETSAVRWLEGPPGAIAARTAIGQGLFDFGFRDGPADQALLQHPLGVTVLPDGSIAVCDTYNGAVRRFDPAAAEVTTLAADLAEPSAAYVDGETLVVVESGAHRLTRLPLGAAGTRTEGFAHTTRRPVTVVPAALELVVAFTPPPGQKVDDRFGPPSSLLVEATPPGLVREGGGRGTDLVRRLVLDPHVGEGVLHVAARAASCDADGGEGAACHMHQQDWGVPVRIGDGEARLVLPLGGEG
jgi:streptogramin lyase